ncbi:DUF4082 domain-containing protein [Chitinophaga niabensis]|uniref:DUF4082 domain-containing protein n=1 Tax=Chitinophaga niabensis TaxID=536979 RepID=UPI0031BB9994
MKILSLILLTAIMAAGCSKMKDRDTVRADGVLATLDDETGPYNVFTTQTPSSTDTDGPYELGMKFQSSQSGTITQIRYYKYSGENGAHTGRLWSAAGTQLTSVTFTGETASGWQTATLSTPYAISANTTYVVTVNSNARYGATTGGLATAVTNGPLSTIVGSNGVYGTTLGAFPTSSYNNSNYFRDITFVGTGTGDVTAPTTPTSVASSDITGYGVDLSWTASTDNVNVTGYNVYNDTVLIASVTGAWANLYGLTPATAYSIKVKAKDAAGNLSAASTALSVTTGAASSGLRGWQIDNTNSGLSGVGVNKNSLPLHSGPIAAGSTISMKKLVDPNLSAGNIIIDRCWIVTTGSGSWAVGSDNGAILIKDSRIEGTGTRGKYFTAPYQAPTNKAVTILRTEITDQGGGFLLNGASLVRNCYIHDLPGYGNPATDTGNHVDGGTRRSGIAQLNVIDNQIDIRSAGSNGSSAFFIQPLWGFIDNILLRGNLFGGGGYTVYAENHSGNTYGSHLYADNNRFYTGPGYGYAGTPSGPGFGVWTNNYVNNPANADNKGTAISNP